MRRADALVRRKMPPLRRDANGRDSNGADRSSEFRLFADAARRGNRRRFAVLPDDATKRRNVEPGPNDATKRRNREPGPNDATKRRNVEPDGTFSTFNRRSSRRRRLALGLRFGNVERYSSSRSRRSLRARNRRRTLRLPPLRASRRLFSHSRSPRRPSSELSRSDARNGKSATVARRRTRRLRGVPLRVHSLRSIARDRRAVGKGPEHAAFQPIIAAAAAPLFGRDRAT